MADSTGPVLAAGTISFLNHWIGNDQGVDLKIPLATLVAAGLLYGLEKISAPLAAGIGWIALVTTFLVTPKSGQSPVANLSRLSGL
jgi:hypothetical protein